MVDASARNVVAALLERLLQGDLTNYQLENLWPQKSNDRFIAELPDILWCYYDDSPERILRSEQFGDDGKAFLQRIIRFLRSANEYQWPTWKPSPDRDSVLRRLVGRLFKNSGDLKNFKAHGDFDVWPFIRRADYEKSVYDIAS